LSSSLLLLVLGSCSFLATVTVVYRARSIGPLLPLYFLIAWLQGELALIHIIWQSLAALGLIYADALSRASGQWGLLLLLLSFGGLFYSLRLSLGARQNLASALVAALGPDFRQQIPESRRQLLRQGINWREWMRPFAMKRPGVECVRNIAYGQAGDRNLLDIYKPSAAIAGKAPVLLQVHGGGWIIGDKTQQALPLINHLAARGWVCVSINYRLSPRHAFPAHIEDTKLALAWIKRNIAQYGGNPDFVAITGGSAGGHLSSLAALTANNAEFQPGFEQADTSVQAAVPFYGVYDWLDASGAGGDQHMKDLLNNYVLQSSPEENTRLWDIGRPLANIHSAAPPMMIVHGSHDSLVWVEDARYFANALRDVSQAPVAYVELQGAQHAYEVFHSIRCDYTVNAVSEFLEWTYADWLQQRQAPQPEQAPLDAVSA
jgi:acetyl esterase/lipase